MPQNLIVTVLGRKASGKSTLVSKIIADAPRLIVIDTVGEYGQAQKIVPIHGIIECCDALAACEKRATFRISCRADETEDLLDLLNICYELPNILLVVEETSFFCSPAFLPPEISKLVRYGRHREISQVYVSRRASEIHREITAQSDLIVSFEQREPRDIEYLAITSGQSPRALVAAFQRLPRYRCFVWGDVERAPLAVIECMEGASTQLKIPLDNPPEDEVSLPEQ